MKKIAIASLLLLSFGSETWAGQSSPLGELSAEELQCEYRLNRLGIDVARPRLSWTLESKERGQKQTAYQVLVGTSRDKSDLWDSGKVRSDQSAHIVYGGKELMSCQRAYWKVRIWDKNVKVSPWSESAWWEMGLLSPNDWKASWIGLPLEPKVVAETLTQHPLWIWYPENGSVSHFLQEFGLKKSFKMPKGTRYFWRTLALPKRKIKKALFILAADDRFVLYVNEKKAGEGNNWRQFSACDISSYLKTETNTIRVEVTNNGGSAGFVGKLRVEFDSGEPLVIVTDRMWKVVKDSSLSSALTSAQELAPLGKGPWGSKLSHRLLGEDIKLSSPYLRKEFDLSKPIRRARLYATALGLYELSINGKRVSNAYFTPGWTDYTQRLHYQSYDVSEYLKEGRNAIGAILGDGWYAGYVGWSSKRHLYGSYPLRFLAQLDIEFMDGRSQTIATDSSWRGSSKGPILYSDMQEGEFYDGRLELDGWDLAGYNADSWHSVQAFEDYGKQRLVAQPDEPIKIMASLKPIKVTEPQPGTFIFDFGQNIAGWVQLKVKGSKGAQVALRHAEMLNPDGTIYTANLRQAQATDRYILKGKGIEIYEPRFTYHGFRYVEIKGYPGKPGLDAIEAKVVHSALSQRGHFETSHEMINKLYKNILWSQRGNFISIPTDCPSRDERLGWMGDIQLFAQTAAYNMDIAPFLTKWMRDVRDGQRKDGSFCDVAPCVLRETEAAPAWGDAGVIVPWVIYQHYGDIHILGENYDAMKVWVDHIHKANPNLIWTKQVGENFGDWLAPDPNTPKEVVSTAYFANNARIVFKTAEVLGKTEDAKNYSELSQKIKEAYAFDLLPKDKRGLAAKHLIQAIKNNGSRLSTGFVGTSLILPALTETGNAEVAYKLLLDEGYPSWLYQVRLGATTIWERWDGWIPEKGFQDASMNSFNHYAFGSVGEWFYRSVLGIEKAKPGFKEIILHPYPGGNLIYARGKVNSIYGEITSNWRIKNNKFLWKVTIPPNTTATAFVPGKNVTESGTPAHKSKGVTFLKREKDSEVYSILSGNYEFEAEI